MTQRVWPFGDLPMFGFDLIMCDPPWSFDNWSESGEKKNAKSQYACMSIQDICELPIGDLASPDCVLWLWATNPMLPEAIQVLNAWGFKFKTAGTWLKKTRHGKVHFGTGYILRSANESFLIGTIGKPKVSRNVRSAVIGEARAHSQKPEEGYEAAENLMPDARRVEIFSRMERPGWQTWGDEVGKLGDFARPKEINYVHG